MGGSSERVGQKLRVRDVKAEDYATPEKYLDGAEIPTFYQFQSNLVADEDLKPGMVRNLEVDKRLTLPTRTHIRFLVTGQDVLHCWSVPALGVKTDATPGRLNRISTFIQREGVFYGQCSELCGTFMDLCRLLWRQWLPRHMPHMHENGIKS